VSNPNKKFLAECNITSSIKFAEIVVVVALPLQFFGRHRSGNRAEQVMSSMARSDRHKAINFAVRRRTVDCFCRQEKHKQSEFG
jgi:hypothetical protein